MKKSLNETLRKMKIEEIDEANQRLYDRIKYKESEYSAEKFLIERKEAVKILNLISEFRQPPMAVVKMEEFGKFKKIGKRDDGGKRKILHRQGKVIRGNCYLVEVARDRGGFRVEAFNLKISQKLWVLVSLSEVFRICGDDFEFRILVDRVMCLRGR